MPLKCPKYINLIWDLNNMNTLTTKRIGALNFNTKRYKMLSVVWYLLRNTNVSN